VSFSCSDYRQFAGELYLWRGSTVCLQKTGEKEDFHCRLVDIFSGETVWSTQQAPDAGWTQAEEDRDEQGFRVLPWEPAVQELKEKEKEMAKAHRGGAGSAAGRIFELSTKTLVVVDGVGVGGEAGSTMINASLGLQTDGRAADPLKRDESRKFVVGGDGTTTIQDRMRARREVARQVLPRPRDRATQKNTHCEPSRVHSLCPSRVLSLSLARSLFLRV
jgi:hypothetical protein